MKAKPERGNVVTNSSRIDLERAGYTHSAATKPVNPTKKCPNCGCTLFADDDRPCKAALVAGEQS